VSEQTISVHISREAADRLLALAGIVPEPVPGGNAFTLPGGVPRSEGGKFGRDYVWEIDEATEIAIVALTGVERVVA
jgi:hypothetical protein